MTGIAWKLLKPGSIILSKRTNKPRMVLNSNSYGCVTLIRGDGITVYCNGDKYLFIATGLTIKII